MFRRNYSFTTHTFCTPVRVTVLPRQLIEDTHERHGHVVNSPGDNEVIVQHHNAGDYHHPVS